MMRPELQKQSALKLQVELSRKAERLMQPPASYSAFIPRLEQGNLRN